MAIRRDKKGRFAGGGKSKLRRRGVAGISPGQRRATGARITRKGGNIGAKGAGRRNAIGNLSSARRHRARFSTKTGVRRRGGR